VEDPSSLVRWIPALPLATALLGGLWLILAGRPLPRLAAGFLHCAGPIAAFGISVWLTTSIATQLEPASRLLVDEVYTWISAGDLHAEVAFLFDPLSAVMCLVVTGVGSLIHLYSVGYMGEDDREDAGFARFFAYLNLFLGAMLVLVLADNLVLMFLGWEGVGLCSYLLIGFWYLDDYNARCGQKAFVVNRIGDFAFLLGIFLLFWAFADAGSPTLSFRAMAQNVELLAGRTLEVPAWLGALGFEVPSWQLLSLACVLLFIGACGKSAQLPLHVWLPDAMAGPTPVSALIHAATMVTAGVYMVSRMSFAYDLAPGAQAAVAWVGALTALFAASVALVQKDIKRVLAWSTVSQLGYMFLAAGVAAYTAALFHVVTHAFFKALLFLAAGSVILSLHHEQNIDHMGGLKRALPWTRWTFLAGVLALAGLPLASGFLSKEEILLAVSVAHATPGHAALLVLGLVTATLTAFYSLRLYMLVFEGRSRAAHGGAHGHHEVHERGAWILAPLVLLALLALAGGALVGLPDLYGEMFLDVPESNSIHHFLTPVVGHARAEDHAPHGALFLGSALIFALAGGFAVLLYKGRIQIARDLLTSLAPVRRVLANAYGVDALYEALVTRPLERVSRGFLHRVVDVRWIDGAGVHGVVALVRGLAERGLRRFQDGLVQSYVFLMLIGGLTLLFWMVRKGAA
jgi:NADH-quinone oxidoreductase subunit L